MGGVASLAQFSGPDRQTVIFMMVDVNSLPS